MKLMPGFLPRYLPCSQLRLHPSRPSACTDQPNLWPHTSLQIHHVHVGSDLLLLAAAPGVLPCVGGSRCSVKRRRKHAAPHSMASRQLEVAQRCAWACCWTGRVIRIKPSCGLILATCMVEHELDTWNTRSDIAHLEFGIVELGHGTSKTCSSGHPWHDPQNRRDSWS